MTMTTNQYWSGHVAAVKVPRVRGPGDHNESLRQAAWSGLVHLVLLVTQTQTHCCDASQLRANGCDRAAQQIRNPACQGTRLRCATNGYQLHLSARRWCAS